MKPKEVAKISSIVFFIVAILHLIRTLLGWQFSINNFQIPIWVSIVAVIITGYLAYQNWKISK